MLTKEYNFIQVRATDPELQRYRDSFHKNGTERSLENIKWLHQKNLPGINLIYMATTSSGEVASIFAWLPCYLTINSKKVLGMQSLDTLTDMDHRGKGLFTVLARKLEAENSDKAILLVYGFPNQNSTHGYVAKLGYKLCGQAPFLVKPLGFSYILNKLFRHQNSKIRINVPIKSAQVFQQAGDDVIKQIPVFDEEYDRFWESMNSSIKLGICRDSNFMNWRYLQKPGEAYTIFGYFQSNKLVGVVVFCLKNKHGGKIGYLMELLYDPTYIKVGRALLRLSSSVLRRNKGQLILAWCTPYSYNYLCYKNAGYFRLPEKLRPVKIGFIVKALDMNYASFVYDIKNWYLSYTDSDTV